MAMKAIYAAISVLVIGVFGAGYTGFLGAYADRQGALFNLKYALLGLVVAEGICFMICILAFCLKKLSDDWDQ